MQPVHDLLQLGIAACVAAHPVVGSHSGMVRGGGLSSTADGARVVVVVVVVGGGVVVERTQHISTCFGGSISSRGDVGSKGSAPRMLIGVSVRTRDTAGGMTRPVTTRDCVIFVRKIACALPAEVS